MKNKLKVFLDCCVLMDFFDNRENCESAESILALGEREEIVCYTSSNIICTLSYLFEKYKVMPRQDIPEALESLTDIVHILPVGEEEIEWAINNTDGDFEDAVECACADKNCDFVITGNVKDFKNSQCKVTSPKDFLIKYLS